MGVRRIGVIGCGNMGSAIVKGLLKKGLTTKEDILLNDMDKDKMSALSDSTGCLPLEPDAMISSSDIVIIAIKPQDFQELARSISDRLGGKTVLSVMAGIKISDLEKKLDKGVSIARAMPNMAAFVSESITCVSFNDKVSDRQEVVDIFSAIGDVMTVDESLMDLITAVSGSGPAYLFFLAEAMTGAAVKAGLQRETAEKLVRQTLYGAARILKESGEGPSDLIDRVASRGGTTEAALAVFQERKFTETVHDAVMKARDRSVELSKR